MASSYGKTTSRPSGRTDAERRKASRDKCRGRARAKGDSPRVVLAPDDLAWAFAGHEHEIGECEELAREHAERRAAKHVERQHRQELAALTDSILAERRETREREERESAEAEARRRIEAGE